MRERWSHTSALLSMVANIAGGKTSPLDFGYGAKERRYEIKTIERFRRYMGFPAE